VSDVGSVKRAAIEMLAPHLPKSVHLVPGHPVAGTEHSGPEAGFATLFDGHWTILTPPKGTDTKAVERVAELWRRCGAQVEIMDADHHDHVLAITSHVPHVIAYSIVGTATHLAEQTRSEVIKFAASGFRDFTRIAASDPTMWRDIFLNNRDAVLEMLGRLLEDVTVLQRAIRFGDGDKMFELLSRGRAIRRGVIEAGQHIPPAPDPALPARKAPRPRRARGTLAKARGRVAPRRKRSS
jgi:cyclohexadieny/prephenate dehydrogenase